MEAQKYCPQCKTWKFYTEFSKNRVTKDGYRGRCKECDSKNGKTYRSDPLVQALSNERARVWAQTNRERHNAKSTRWRANNRDKQRVIEKRWYDRYGMLHKREYRETHRTQFRRYYATRRARRYKLPYEHVNRAAIIARDNSTCYLCGMFTSDPILDHVVPLSRGGPHLATNLRVACKPCNSRKGTRLTSELDWYTP